MLGVAVSVAKSAIVSGLLWMLGYRRITSMSCTGSFYSPLGRGFPPEVDAALVDERGFSVRPRAVVRRDRGLVTTWDVWVRRAGAGGR